MSRKSEILFGEEESVLHLYKSLSDFDEVDTNYKDALKVLTEKYKELLNQTKFLTRMGDRLENRLHTVNATLAQKNVDLSTALDDLTKARVSKQAYFIIYLIATMLFVFEEFFIDPVVSVFGTGIWIVLIIKLCIALLLKPTESLLENRFLSRIRKKLK
jgi:hypothetical protein